MSENSQGAEASPLSDLYLENRWALVVVPQPRGWKLATLPRTLLETSYPMSAETDISLETLIVRAGRHFDDEADLLENIGSQLKHAGRLKVDVAYRAEAYGKEQRIWRLYSKLLPGLRRVVKRGLGAAEDEGSGGDDGT